MRKVILVLVTVGVAIGMFGPPVAAAGESLPKLTIPETKKVLGQAAHYVCKFAKRCIGTRVRACERWTRVKVVCVQVYIYQRNRGRERCDDRKLVTRVRPGFYGLDFHSLSFRCHGVLRT